MVLTYEMIQNATMSVSQYNAYINEEAKVLAILFLVGFTVVIACLFYITYKYIKLKNFVKEKKLQKQFQEYKNDNKGLD